MNSILPLLFSFTLLFTIAIPVGGCVVVALSHRFDINAKASSLKDLVDWRDAMERWLLLPLIAYVLAIVTNVGTAMAFPVESGHVSVQNVGFNILMAGAGALMVSALFAGLYFTRSQWKIVDSWRLLEAEVRDKVDSGEMPTVRWIGAVVEKRSQLSAHPPRDERLATRANTALSRLGPTLPSARPWLGLGNWTDPRAGRFKIPWRLTLRWSWRRSKTWVTVAFELSTVGLIVALLTGESSIPRVAVLAFVHGLISLMALLAWARADLIFYYRRFDERQHIEARITQTLNTWTAAVPLPRWRRLLVAWLSN